MRSRRLQLAPVVRCKLEDKGLLQSLMVNALGEVDSS